MAAFFDKKPPRDSFVRSMKHRIGRFPIITRAVVRINQTGRSNTAILSQKGRYETAICLVTSWKHVSQSLLGIFPSRNCLEVGLEGIMKIRECVHEDLEGVVDNILDLEGFGLFL